VSSFFQTPIEFLKGVGPQRAALLQKELNIFTYGDLLQHYPFRHEDRTKFYSIKEVNETMPNIQLRGRITGFEMPGMARKKRLVGYFTDGTGEIELVWFQGIKWVQEKIKTGIDYVVFGKPNRFGRKISIAHPEIEPVTARNEKTGALQPVYSLTDKLRVKHMDSKFLLKLVEEVLRMAENHIRETLPANVIASEKLIAKKMAVQQIHFPKDLQHLAAAQYRLKFEELFYIQLRLLKLKLVRQEKFKGIAYTEAAALVTEFYNNHLPFALTDAQKRVVKEIYADMRSGKQMNRLLQGDVGSGKTIVAFICALLVISGGGQVALMAPTEILAQQHFKNLQKYANMMKIPIALLTGSTKQSERRPLHIALQENHLKILIGTHALIEDEVKFNKLGLAIIDEQHRFGVAQRSQLWQKNDNVYPHVLVMTATPIPRTLAMTLYGDLEISTINELPKGRKPIVTTHKYDSHRSEVFGFMRKQIEAGRQVYIVYPLIEESEKLDLKHLMDGYESISRAFPEVAISIVHGKMKPDAKDFEMGRFVRAETKIMVATTVIEVGVDVPNASVMVIENAERFGLSQLHQLRGRVGRGAEQSYCILMTDYKLSNDSRIRVDTLVRTNDGFEIAETDLKLRGPGDLMGTQQSGALDLLIADLGKDQAILQQARNAAIRLLEDDPDLKKVENSVIKQQIESMKKTVVNWSRIS
jgi:ATP-dependent DNA helicase RecG